MSPQGERSFPDVLAAAKSGDRQAFDWLYTRYAGRLRAFAMARGNEDPEAIANDVMLRAFQHLEGFQGDDAAFVRWLFTIARNRLIDAHRSAERRPTVSDVAMPDSLQASAETVAIDNLATERVVEMLGVLTVEQREVLALRLVEDLSLADVALIVGRPVTAVKALQRRGLRSLARKISDQGVS